MSRKGSTAMDGLPDWAAEAGRASDVVAHEEHRRAHAQEEEGQEVLDLAVAERLHLRRAARPLYPAVPAPVVVGAVPVALAVGLVVLVVVGDEVVEREAVVTGHEVDALLRLPLLVAVEVGAAQETRGQSGDRARVCPQEAAHVVAKAPVPLLPGVADEAADLVTPAYSSLAG
jgi:hypothetical protein